MDPWNLADRRRALRAAFLVRTFDIGGSERQLVALTRGLVTRGHDALVVVLEGSGALVPELRAEKVDVYEATARGIRSLPLRLPDLVAALRRWQPDVLHAYLPAANVLAPALLPLLRGAPVVLGVRTVAPERDASSVGVRTLYRAETVAAQFARAIIANSCAARDEAIARGFPQDRIEVIPNGIDIDRFEFDERARAALRAEWSIGDDEILIGRVGRMRTNKDYPSFLEAAAKAATRVSSLRFVCVGDGPERRELEALAHRLDLSRRLVWAGERNDMPAVMSALEVFVSSSRVESFPNVIGEAMACGVPCVVTDVGDSAAIVGNTGIVVPPNVPGLLADAIVDLSARIPIDSQIVRGRIENEFGLGTMITRTERLLTELVSGGNARQ